MAHPSKKILGSVPLRRSVLVAGAALALGAAAAAGSVRTVDLVYESPGNTVYNRFDLYTLGSGVLPGAPTVIDLHGGGYTTGDKGLDQQVCYLLAERGFNVISMNYTLAWPGQTSSFPQTFRDVRAVIRWVRTTGVQLGLSPTIVMTGQSAGCTIGVAAAFAPDTPEFDPPLPPPPGGYAVDAVVGLFGRYDLVWDAQTFGSPASIVNYLGLYIFQPGGIERYAAAAARTYVGPCSPPTQLTAGDLDGVVPVGNTTRLAAALSAASVFTILHVVPGAGHGSEQLGSPPYLANEIALAIPTLLGAANPGCATPPVAPVNDNCTDASELEPGGSVPGSTIGATPDGTSPCGMGDSRDVWYRFVAADSLLYTFDTVGSSMLARASLAAFTGCAVPPLGGDGVLACDSGSGPGGSCRVSLLLASGQSVLLRVAGGNGSVGYFRLNVNAGEVYFPPPPNDLCAGAATVPVGTTQASTLGATGTTPGVCGDGDEGDVWYSFAAPMSARYRFEGVCGAGLPGCSLSILTACAGPVLACDRSNDAGSVARVEATLAAGQTALIRVAGERRMAGSITLSIGRAPGPQGSCCAAGVCTPTDSFACNGGVFSANLPCEANPCQPVGQASGACCTGALCTLTDGAAMCGGGFLGAGTLCGAAGNPVACCDANFNRVGGVSVQDVFDFLSAYFAADLRADFNRSGAVSVQDIFDFLSAYFAGCG